MIINVKIIKKCFICISMEKNDKELKISETLQFNKKKIKRFDYIVQTQKLHLSKI